jgi:hypothetical protein
MVSKSLTRYVVIAAAAVVHVDSNMLSEFLDKQSRIFGDARQICLLLAEDITHAKLSTFAVVSL